MTRSALRRTVVSFLFFLLSLTALAAAAPLRSCPKTEPLKSQPIFSFLWAQMSRLWEKEGSSLDPDGKQRPDGGGSLDPNGFLLDNGGSLDPDGAK